MKSDTTMVGISTHFANVYKYIYIYIYVHSMQTVRTYLFTYIISMKLCIHNCSDPLHQTVDVQRSRQRHVVVAARGKIRWHCSIAKSTRIRLERMEVKKSTTLQKAPTKFCEKQLANKTTLFNKQKPGGPTWKIHSCLSFLFASENLGSLAL